MNASIKISGLNPPLPEEPPKDDSASESEISKKARGQRLLTLVRTVEKQSEDESNNDRFDETIEYFNYLIALFSRKGILEGDTTRAEGILSSQTSNTNSGKRPSKKGSNNNELRINQGEDKGDKSGDLKQQETLVFTAILRVLSTQSFDDDSFLLIALAAELCVAISQSIKMKPEDDKCGLAEYELVSQSGKELLKSLATTIHNIEIFLRQQTVSDTNCRPESLDKCLVLVSLDESEHVAPINSCLKAAASLVGLFGTKLSRSTALLTEISSSAWRCLTFSNDSIQESASKLIAIIPSAGGIDRKTPSDLWNETTVDVIWLLARVVETIAPVNKISHRNEVGLSDRARALLDSWTLFVRDEIMDESARVLAFYRIVSGLSKCFHSLLLKDGSDPTSRLAKLEAKLGIESILCVVESFLSFSLSAETVYNKTKKRLRNEVVDGGLLSPKAVSSQTANHIKLIGHSILDCLLSSLGGPSLMPYARRIIRISYASLLTSCSGPVRKVIDPTMNVQLDGKRKRWLHLSLPMRTAAIRTFEVVIVSFGSDRGGGSNFRSGSTERSDGELAASLVAACLIEQFSKNSAKDEVDEDWGCFSDRMELIMQCSSCLRAVLASCGGFLSNSTRSLIDSAISTVLSCLLTLPSTTSNVFDWSPIKVAMLDLGSCSVATPCNDGAASNLLGILSRISHALDTDKETGVATAAKAALRVCDAAFVPRAPPLLFVTRAVVDHTANARPAELASAEEAIENMKAARAESERAAKLAKEVEKAKKKKQEEKRLREQQAKEEKAAKRQRIKKNAEASSEATEKDQSASKTAWSNPQRDATSEGQSNTTRMSVERASADDDSGRNQSAAENQIVAPEAEKEDAETKESTEKNADSEGVDDDRVLSKNQPVENEVQDNGKGADDDDDDDDDDEFPDIVGGGPDSDDE